jgi:hypothetical protein
MPVGDDDYAFRIEGVFMDVQAEDSRGRRLLRREVCRKRYLTAPFLEVRLGDPSLRRRIGLFWLTHGMAMAGYLII